MSRGFQQQLATMRAIGHVETTSADEARIVIDPQLTGGLTGLEPGQQLLVLYRFHRAGPCELLQHPRGDTGRPKRGVFSLCSPRRPNPIGLCMVDIVAIQDNVLTVRNLDALDGTPVLDLKPAGPWFKQRE